ncbi:MAG TPA: hypothetical protein P5551_10535 [Syntrophales bacterium]|nr:hypothetical protein [Syntrophales bacterium]
MTKDPEKAMTTGNLEKLMERALLEELSREERALLEKGLRGAPDLLAKWKELDRIAFVARHSPQVEPPADLDAKVMARIEALKPTLWIRVREFFLQPVDTRIDFGRAYSGTLSGSECSFYFITAGLYFLIVGLILMFGLGRFGGEWLTVGWVRMQPHIVLVTAVWLVVLGIFILKDGEVAARVARIGTVAYIGLLILDAVAIHITAGFPVALVFLFSFIGTGVLAGLFLARVIWNYGKKYAAL